MKYLDKVLNLALGTCYGAYASAYGQMLLDITHGKIKMKSLSFKELRNMTQTILQMSDFMTSEEELQTVGSNG